jgi:uncharacterized membrane protein
MEMPETVSYSFIFAVVGLLFIGIGIPLILERVPPNRYYGFRTAKTLSDRRVWYAADRICETDVLLAGIIITIASVVMLFFGYWLKPEQVVFTLLAVMVLSLTGALIHGFKALNKM